MVEIYIDGGRQYRVAEDYDSFVKRLVTAGAHRNGYVEVTTVPGYSGGQDYRKLLIRCDKFIAVESRAA